jgi:hypothetical protein
MSGWIDYFQASFSILSSDSSSSRSSSRKTSRSTQVEPTISFNYSNDVSIDKSGDDSGSDKYNNRYTFDANILDNYDIIYSTFNSSECIQSLLNDVIYDLFLTNDNNKESNLLNDGYDYNNTCNNGDIYFTIAGKNDDNDDNYDDSRKNSCGSSSSSSYIHSKTYPYIAAPAITNTDLHHHHQHNHHDGGLLCKHTHTWSTYSIKRKLVSLIKLLVSQLCVPPIMAIYGIGRQLG